MGGRQGQYAVAGAQSSASCPAPTSFSQLFDESLALLALWSLTSSATSSSSPSPKMSPYGLSFVRDHPSLPRPSAVIVSFTNDDSSTGTCSSILRLLQLPSRVFRRARPAGCHSHQRHSKHEARHGLRRCDIAAAFCNLRHQHNHASESHCCSSFSPPETPRYPTECRSTAKAASTSRAAPLTPLSRHSALPSPRCLYAGT